MSEHQTTVPKRAVPRGSRLRARTGTPTSSSLGDLYDDPTDLAVTRLRALVHVYAFVTLIITTLTTLVHLGVMEVPFAQNTGFNYAVLAPGAVTCVVVSLATRHKRPARQVLAMSTVFQIIGGLSISLLEQQSPRDGAPIVALWILTFTLIPAPPRRAAVTAYMTAAMLPLAIFLHVVFGERDVPSRATEYVTMLSGFLSAIISVFISKVIYGLGRQVEKARKLGAYELVEELGHGGMGEVWRAEHHSLIRPAAVKLMRRELTAQLAPAEREALNVRFQREVQSTAMLTSPHTVAIYDFGETHDGTLYYVMELLHGLDAETLVEKYGPQPAERVMYLLMQACESLAEAHARNLIHRDIKPANIYLCAIGLQVDFVKVLDFGLVRDLSSGVRVTNEGSVSGTPAYLAPESATRRQFDARSDIYALGCVAYYMLTGQLVFEGQTAPAVMAAHIRDQAVAPSKRSELPIPRELDELVLACLAKEPADRPQSAQELHARLSSIAASSAWSQERATSWWSAHVPELVARACENCEKPIVLPPAQRRRPAPVVRMSAETRT